jgi:hypothetical protein
MTTVFFVTVPNSRFGETTVFNGTYEECREYIAGVRERELKFKLGQGQMDLKGIEVPESIISQVLKKRKTEMAEDKNNDHLLDEIEVTASTLVDDIVKYGQVRTMRAAPDILPEAALSDKEMLDLLCALSSYESVPYDDNKHPAVKLGATIMADTNFECDHCHATVRIHGGPKCGVSPMFVPSGEIKVILLLLKPYLFNVTLFDLINKLYERHKVGTAKRSTRANPKEKTKE